MALISASAAIQDRDGSPDEEDEMKREDTEFVLSQMLKLAVNLDYSDEIGRRKMFGLVRESTSLFCFSTWTTSFSRLLITFAVSAV